MKTFTEWLDTKTFEECINSAANALEKAGISYERKGNKLVVAEEDAQEAKAVVKDGASTPDDIKFVDVA